MHSQGNEQFEITIQDLKTIARFAAIGYEKSLREGKPAILKYQKTCYTDTVFFLAALSGLKMAADTIIHCKIEPGEYMKRKGRIPFLSYDLFCEMILEAIERMGIIRERPCITIPKSHLLKNTAQCFYDLHELISPQYYQYYENEFIISFTI